MDFSKFLTSPHAEISAENELHALGKNDFFAMRPSRRETGKLVKPSWAVDTEDQLCQENLFDRSKLSSIKKPNGRVRKSAPMRLGANDSLNADDIGSPKGVPRSSNGIRRVRLSDKMTAGVETLSDLSTSIGQFNTPSPIGSHGKSGRRVQSIDKIEVAKRTQERHPHVMCVL